MQIILQIIRKIYTKFSDFKVVILAVFADILTNSIHYVTAPQERVILGCPLGIMKRMDSAIVSSPAKKCQ